VECAKPVSAARRKVLLRMTRGLKRGLVQRFRIAVGKHAVHVEDERLEEGLLSGMMHWRIQAGRTGSINQEVRCLVRRALLSRLYAPARHAAVGGYGLQVQESGKTDCFQTPHGTQQVVRGELPDRGDRILANQRVRRRDGARLRHGLCHEQPVERVSVVEGQPAELERCVLCDGECVDAV